VIDRQFARYQGIWTGRGFPRSVAVYDSTLGGKLCIRYDLRLRYPYEAQWTLEEFWAWKETTKAERKEGAS